MTEKFKARVVPWSSVVGTGIVLLDTRGQAVAQLALLNVQAPVEGADCRARALEIVESVAAAINSK